MLESIQAVSLLTIMEIVGPVLLLAVLIYGTLQWSRRRRGPIQAVREAATRELYREGARAEKRKKQVRRRRGKVHQPTAAPAIGRRWLVLFVSLVQIRGLKSDIVIILANTISLALLMGILYSACPS